MCFFLCDLHRRAWHAQPLSAILFFPTTLIDAHANATQPMSAFSFRSFGDLSPAEMHPCLWGETTWNECGVIFAVAKGLVDVRATIARFFVFWRPQWTCAHATIVRFCFFGDPNGRAFNICPFFVSSFCGDLNRRACHATIGEF